MRAPQGRGGLGERLRRRRHGRQAQRVDVLEASVMAILRRVRDTSSPVAITVTRIVGEVLPTTEPKMMFASSCASLDQLTAPRSLCSFMSGPPVMFTHAACPDRQLFE
jgi:hypothetical protein